MKRQGMGLPVDLPVFLPDHLKPPVAMPEYLDVLQAVYALQHQGFHFSQPGAVAHSHAPSGPYGDEGKDHADDEIHRKKHRRKQGIKRDRQSQGNAGQDNHREHWPNGVGKKVFDGFNIRHRDI